MSRYRVPQRVCRVEIRVSNSRFISTIGPAASVKAAHEFVRGIREEMPDATHHVHAFRIGHGASVSEGMSDDGEPPGTASRPALAVVRGSDVGDIVLVITRYFGGTKLGTGGLVAAYGDAAKAALQALPTEEKVERIRFAINVPYALHDQVRRLLREHQGLVDEEEFGAQVRLVFQIPEEHVAAFSATIQDMSGGRVGLEPSDGCANDAQ